ncbi:unnamed protein product [Nesidiocoris tenuis]|uniref:RIIa domain-containing protein n=1 Tax=Nesidiocoris tenuis TaxID=355587 RepID=A0A6H5H5U1_9HEMI|nr:unnamed protein product [Nesidiocoris tenuis]
MAPLMKVNLPVGIGEAMEGLTRAVLLAQPNDIYEFAAKHFDELIAIRTDGGEFRGCLQRLARRAASRPRRLVFADPSSSVSAPPSRSDILLSLFTRRSLIFLAHYPSTFPRRSEFPAIPVSSGLRFLGVPPTAGPGADRSRSDTRGNLDDSAMPPAGSSRTS